jgi:hypothetical protein
MVGILDPNDPNSSAFFATPPGTYSAMESRRRLALQLLANSKKGYPTTIGQGLTAIGDAIGDRSVLSQLAGQEAEYAKTVGADAEAGIPAEARTPGPQSAAPASPAVSAAVAPIPSRPLASPLAATPADTSDDDPGLNGPVRTNPDGSIAGNLTAPTRPPGPSSGLIPPRINGIDPRTRMAMALAPQLGGLRPNPTDPEAATPPDIQALVGSLISALRRYSQAQPPVLPLPPRISNRLRRVFRLRSGRGRRQSSQRRNLRRSK